METNEGETINYVNNPSYSEIKAALKKELMVRNK